MITRRRLLVFGVFASLTVLSVGVGGWLVWRWPRAGITAANGAKIHEGMSRAEVERLLGCPPGDYRTPKCGWDFDCHFSHPGDSELYEWHGDDSLALVAFDRDGIVVAYAFHESPRDESLLAVLRRLLRL